MPRRSRMRLRERVAARQAGLAIEDDAAPPKKWRGRLRTIGTVLQFAAFALLILEVFRLLESNFASPNYTLVMIYSGAFLSGRMILAILAVSPR